MKISQVAKITLVVGLISAFGNLNAMEGKLKVSLPVVVDPTDDAITRMLGSRWTEPISEGSIEKVKALILLKEDVNEDCGGGCTPLHMAASKNPNPTIVKLLLAAGANPEIKATVGALKGKTPFETAQDDKIKMVFLTHPYPKEVESIIPRIITFKQKEKRTYQELESFARGTMHHLFKEKVENAKQHLTEYSEDQLKKIIEDGVIEALNRSHADALNVKEEKEDHSNKPYTELFEERIERIREQEKAWLEENGDIE